MVFLQQFAGFSRKKSVEFVVAAFNVSTETFWRKRSTFGKDLSFWLLFILLFNVLPQVSQNGLLRVQKNNLRSFFWIYFGFMLGLRAKNYRTLEYKALPLSSKQHPIYWEDHIWEILFWIFCSSRSFFRPWEKFLWTFGKSLSTGLLKLFYMRPGLLFEEH